jgi:hypothetical protein
MSKILPPTLQKFKKVSKISPAALKICEKIASGGKKKTVVRVPVPLIRAWMKCTIKQFQLLFCKEKRSSVRHRNPQLTFSELTKTLGAQWTAMSDAEKQVSKRLVSRFVSLF